jgi:hypothetical protein
MRKFRQAFFLLALSNLTVFLLSGKTVKTKKVSGDEITVRLLGFSSARDAPVEEGFELVKDGKPIFRYWTKPSAESKKHAPHFSRSGYIHPLYSPSGKIITGDYSADHVHQHGLFFAWTKSSFRGMPTEFWNQAKKLGDVRFKRFLGEEKTADSVSYGFQHHFTNGKSSDEPILLETWRVEIPWKPLPYHQFDLTSTQTCATKDPLLIQKYHYGGMAIRGNPQWLKKDKNEKPKGKMLTSEGKNAKNGNHSRPRWVAIYGPVDGQVCGVVVMNHPDNFRYPQWVRLHPSKPYFVYAPMVDEPFSIKPGKPYVSKFRYLTFDDEPDLELIEKVWKEWSKKR